MTLRRGVAILFLFISVVFMHFYTRSASRADPDHYFHLALSRIESVAGTVHTLPQADDLEWTHQFTDKEFLFHWLGRYAYRWGGEVGVTLLSPLATFAVLMILLMLSASWGSFWPAFVAEVLFFFLSPQFYNRMIMLRPHLLAMVCFCGLVAGIVRGRPILAFVSSFCFGLAYHSYFIPGVAIALAFPFGMVLLPWKRAFFGALLGLTLGVLVNPYFPENIQVMFMVLNEAVNVKANRFMGTGWELMPLSLPILISVYWSHFLIVIGGALLLVMSPLRRKWQTLEFAPTYYLAALSFVFLAALVRSPRSNEYLVPSMVLFIASFFQKREKFLPFLKTERWRTRVLFIAPLALILFLAGSKGYYGPIYGEVLERLRGKPITNEFQYGESLLALRALQLIPKGSAGKKIFTCEWWLGSYVLYSHPEMKFIDANAPDYLWLTNTDKAITRIVFRRGQSPDPYDVVTRQFGSSYVLCESMLAILEMEKDPRFERLFPRKEDTSLTQMKIPFLYAVK